MNNTKLDTDLLVRAIVAAEKGTSGEIRIHICKKAVKRAAIDEARAVFAELKMHETRERNAVLLWVDLHGKQFTLFGDQGIHDRVTQKFWDELKSTVEAKIKTATLTEGFALAIHAIGDALKEHFPARGGDNPDELSNEVTGG